MTAGNASTGPDFRRLRAVPKLTEPAPDIGEGISHCQSLLTAALPLNNTVGHGKIVMLVTAAVSGAPSPDALSEAASAFDSGVIVMTVGGPDSETLALSDEFHVRADRADAAMADLGARVAAALCTATPFGRFKQSLSTTLYVFPAYPGLSFDFYSFSGRVEDVYRRHGARAVVVSGQCDSIRLDRCGWYMGSRVCSVSCYFTITYLGPLVLGQQACPHLGGASCSWPVPA